MRSSAIGSHDTSLASYHKALGRELRVLRLDGEQTKQQIGQISHIGTEIFECLMKMLVLHLENRQGLVMLA